MCRHLAYLGPPVTLAECVLHQPHSLLHQSWAPADMRGGGTINADGFGIGWLVGDPGGDPGGDLIGVDAGVGVVARRYRRDVPMWSDASLSDLAASISSGAILAAVRSATAGMPVGETACAPFIEGPSMFSHNGVINGWPDSVAPLAHALPTGMLMTLAPELATARPGALQSATLPNLEIVIQIGGDTIPNGAGQQIPAGLIILLEPGSHFVKCASQRAGLARGLGRHRHARGVVAFLHPADRVNEVTHRGGQPAQCACGAQHQPDAAKNESQP